MDCSDGQHITGEGVEKSGAVESIDSKAALWPGIRFAITAGLIAHYQEEGYTSDPEVWQEATQRTLPAVVRLLTVGPLDALALSYTGS